MVDRVVLNLWNHAGSLPDIRAFRDSAVIVFGGKPIHRLREKPSRGIRPRSPGFRTYPAHDVYANSATSIS